MGEVPNKLHIVFIITPTDPGKLFFTIRSLAKGDETNSTGFLWLTSEDIAMEDRDAMVEMFISRALKLFTQSLLDGMKEDIKDGELTIQ